MDGGRPRIDKGDVSKFWAHDQVYLIDGRGLVGPYKILAVVRTKVYTLCTLQGQPVGNDAEYAESQLQAA
ncbi:uncharacterized protein F4822DRAFT_427485 [Hypoxylon trugodes]|uniref:uncharacterized protein n=1 Tax=Hypoxylon trugodes TaxID=326681 RepID=UPI00219FEB7A|nr:uncharacterized protein F4822DRAFT_427485 [Hypoxylon trugodes]KAI1391629.1 hypothetical protein F4822DRAFT_427485 [Hypoxylon trugodes]